MTRRSRLRARIRRSDQRLTRQSRSRENRRLWRQLHTLLPLLIIAAYRRIPPRARDALFTSTGASTAALADIAAGAPPWAALWRHGGLRVRGWMTFPSWTDPGPQGFVSAAWKLGDGGRGSP